MARVLEAMIARNRGRPSGARFPFHVVPGFESRGGAASLLRAGHLQGVDRGLVRGQTIENAGNLEGDARAHQNVTDSRQQRAV